MEKEQTQQTQQAEQTQQTQQAEQTQQYSKSISPDNVLSHDVKTYSIVLEKQDLDKIVEAHKRQNRTVWRKSLVAGAAIYFTAAVALMNRLSWSFAVELSIVTLLGLSLYGMMLYRTWKALGADNADDLQRATSELYSLRAGEMKLSFPRLSSMQVDSVHLDAATVVRREATILGVRYWNNAGYQVFIPKRFIVSGDLKQRLRSYEAFLKKDIIKVSFQPDWTLTVFTLVLTFALMTFPIPSVWERVVERDFAEEALLQAYRDGDSEKVLSVIKDDYIYLSTPELLGKYLASAYTLGQLQEVLLNLEQADARLLPGDAIDVETYWKEQGNGDLARGISDEAVAYFELRVVDMNCYDQLQYGYLLNSTQHYAEAITLYDQIIMALEPGRTFLVTSEFEFTPDVGKKETMSEAERIEALCAAYNNTAWAFYEIGEYDLCIAYAKEAITFNPKDPYPMVHWANAIIALEGAGPAGQTELAKPKEISANAKDAEDLYRAALHHDSSNQYACFGLANLLLEENRLTEARDIFYTYTELCPWDLEGWQLLAECLGKLEDYEAQAGVYHSMASLQTDLQAIKRLEIISLKRAVLKRDDSAPQQNAADNLKETLDTRRQEFMAEWDSFEYRRLNAYLAALTAAQWKETQSKDILSAGKQAYEALLEERWSLEQYWELLQDAHEAADEPLIERIFEQASRYHGEVAALTQLSDLYYDAEDYPRVIALSKAIIALEPVNDRGYERLADAYWGMQAYSEAYKAYTACQDYTEAPIYVVNSRMDCLVEQSLYKEAMTLYQESDALELVNNYTRIKAIGVAVALGQKEAAVVIAESVLTDSPIARYRLARMFPELELPLALSAPL